MSSIIDIVPRPEMKPIQIGLEFKTFEVTAAAGAVMPAHHCSCEAVVVVMKGEATLVMADGNVPLQAGMSFLIPARKVHSLKVQQDLKATVIMETTATLEFEGG